MSGQERLSSHKDLKELVLKDHYGHVQIVKVGLIIALPIFIFIAIRFITGEISIRLEYVLLTTSSLFLIYLVPASIATRYHFQSTPNGLHPCCQETLDRFLKKIDKDYLLLEQELLHSNLFWIDKKNAVTTTWIVKPFELDGDNFYIRKDTTFVIKRSFYNYNSQSFELYDNDERNILWKIENVDDARIMWSRLKECLPNAIFKIDTTYFEEHPK